ncbi:MAG: ABC transporter substrate-binding protein, partial [Paenibacillus sp. RIFOXYA1_FULL_44_5]
MKKFIVLVVLAAMITSLTACSTTDSSSTSEKSSPDKQAQVEIRVMWWGDQKRADITNQMLQLFQQKYPNVKVTAEFSPFSGYFDKLNTQLASGTAPDVFTLGSNILDYALKGVLLDLNPYVGKELNVSDISPSLTAFNTFNGKLNGISVGANSRAILINTETFKKAGVPIPSNDWTWDDFAKVNDTIAKNLGKGYYGTYDDSGKYDTLENYFKQRDKVIYDNQNKKLGFTPDDLVKWFAIWDQMRKAGGVVTPELEISAAPDDTSKTLVVTGKVAMEFIPTNQFAAFQSMTKDKLAMLPVPKGPNGNAIDVESSQNIVGYAKTQHPKEVSELMDFWVNDPGAAKILGNDRGVPVSSKMRAVLKKDASEADKQVYDYLDLVSGNKVKPTYNIPGFNEFSQLLTSTSQNIAFG